MPVRVFVVRHGNTFDKGDIVTRVGARTDLSLSNSGRVQAEKLATDFAKHGLSFAAAYTGPLMRTRETLDRILDECTSDRDVEVLEFLREIDYGPDENIAETEVVGRIGQDAIDAWEADFRVPDGWMIDVDFLEREWTAFFERVSRNVSSGNVIVVTSNGIARFAAKVSETNGIEKLKLGTAAFGIVEVAEGERPKVVAWNLKSLD